MRKSFRVSGLVLCVASCTPLAGSGGAREGAAGEVRLESGLSHPLVLAGRPQDEYLHIAVRAPELVDAPRPPLNLALVIDRSGSMASEDKLEHAKSAAEQLVGRLGPEDRVALVSYDDKVQVELPSTSAHDVRPVLAAIRALRTGGSTNLCGGMLAGVEELRRNLDPEHLNVVVLLSDGLANAGVTDPRAIARHAQRAREEGVRITTMGMGLAYDEDLLTTVALEAGGNYYYVDEPESVGRHLDAELDQLGRVAARDVDVRIELGEGVEVRELFGHAWHQDGDEVVVPLRDLVSGQKRKLVLRLGVRGTPGERRTLARVSLTCVDAETRRAQRTVGEPLVAEFVEDAARVERARDRGVLIQAEIVRNAAALDASMRLQKQGQRREAQELLAARYLNSKTLNASDYQDADLERVLRRMQQVLEELERRESATELRDLALETQLQALGYGGD